MNLLQLIEKLKKLSDFFYDNGIFDIYTNSKIYELLIANQLGHTIVNGHANSPDAYDKYDNYYEYKHYKKSSSNYTWTFNDYTAWTIRKLYHIKSVYFTVIDDQSVIPEIEAIYIVSGAEVAQYLSKKTLNIMNHRQMINISANQIIDQMNFEFIDKHDIQLLGFEHSFRGSIFRTALNEIFITAGEIEKLIHVDGILTSNKLWELLTACELGHSINPEQKKHDAYDKKGRTYEYKVSIRPGWTFQDISDNVLSSYLNDAGIILAEVNKREFVVKRIAECRPQAIVNILVKKLAAKKANYPNIRRLTANISLMDIRRMIETGDAKWIPRTYF